MSEPGVPAQTTWPFVGRDGLMDLLSGLHADGSCNGVILRGPVGIGKTRLADEFTRSLTECAVVRCVATPAGQSVPYGAIAHLVPNDSGDSSAPEPRRMLGAVRSVFGGRRAVLMVDEIAFLDETSFTLCANLLALGELFLIGTLRTDHLVPTGLDSITRSFDIRQIDVDALDAVAIAEAARLVVGAPLEDSSAARLSDRCGGNPLYVRELLLQSVATKSVTMTPAGLARIDIGVTAVPRLVELVGSRLESVDPLLRPALHVIAIGEPLLATDLETLGIIDEASQLERAGWIRVDQRGASIEIRLAHPIYGEVLRSTMGVFEYRRQVMVVADAIRRRAVPLRDDALRVAIWELDAGLQPEASVLLEGARRARAAVDLDSTIRLADAAYRVEPTGAAHMLLLEALFLSGRYEDAESCGSMPAKHDTTDLTTLVTVMMLRMDNLLWGIGDADRAWALVQSYRPAFAELGIEFLLAVPEAFIEANNGSSAAALELLGREPDDPSLFILSSLARCVTLAARGHFEQSLLTCQRGVDVVAGLADPRSSVDPLFYRTHQAIAWTNLGRFAEVYETLIPAYPGIVEERMLILRCMASVAIAEAALAQGDLLAADRWFSETQQATDVMNLPSARRVATAGRAAVAGQCGDAEQARGHLRQLDALPDDVQYKVVETQIGRSWAQYCLGSRGDAQHGLRAVTEWALAADEPVAALAGLTELTRMGDEIWSAAHLAQLPSIGEIDGPLAAARIAFIRACAARSGGALLVVARELAELEVHLLAAEAALTAAARFERDGRHREAANARSLGAMSLARCPGANTPASAAPPTVQFLSKRETEVARLASAGASSKAIAEQLFVSTRTVENHLQRVYIKLGISGRDELSDRLDSTRSVTD